MEEKTKYIAVAGMVGSGKTTLATLLAEAIGWASLPESPVAVEYLLSLFRDTKRWAFEVQLDFLCEKSLRVIDQLRKGENFVLDRTVQEDILIFADYFIKRGDIDTLGASTYGKLAAHFKSIIPAPTLIVLCNCGLKTIKDRILSRALEHEQAYPIGFIETLYERYRDWSSSIVNTPVLMVDSEVIDFRDRRNLKELVDIIRMSIRSEAG